CVLCIDYGNEISILHDSPSNHFPQIHSAIHPPDTQEASMNSAQKKSAPIPWLLAAAAACTLGQAATVQAADLAAIRESGTLRVAIANEIPYGYMDLNGEAKGVGPDVAKHIAKALGIGKIEWTTTAFGSLIPGLQADRY